MKENKNGLKSNLNKIDNHVLGATDYSDISELPEQFFNEGQLYKKGKPVQRRTRGKQK